jgi:pimeloyl-ACP methyl ester carboxylesterase
MPEISPNSPLKEVATANNGEILPFRREHGRRAIIFVHGLLGNPRVSWQQFPDLLVQSEALHDWDIFSLGYPSSFRSSLETLSLLLYTRLIHSDLRTYDQLALVTHAEGGLIVQLALLNHEDLAARVSHVFFFAPPNTGLSHPTVPFIQFIFEWPWPLGFLFFKPLLQFLKNTFLKGFFDLLRDSPFLRTLNQRWKDRFGDRAPFQYWAIAADKDQLVSIDSLTLFPAARRLVVPGNHFSLVKPDALGNASVQILVNALVNRLPPEPVQKAAQGTIALETKVEAREFDALLYCNSADSEALYSLSEQLKHDGIRPWLIKEQTPPGQRWDKILMTDIDRVKSLVICIGKSGPGRRQDEQAALFDEFSKRNRSVIPVYLPTCPPEDDELPAFLAGLDPVDFRDPASHPLDLLKWGITGRKPAVRPRPQTTAPGRVPLVDVVQRRRLLPIAATVIVGILVLGAAGWRAYEYWVSSTTRPRPLDMASSGRNKSHYVREAGHDRVLVFVHGFLGNAEDTWLSPPNTYWPELLTHDRDFNDTDIYVAKYDTSVGNRMDIDELVISLNQRLISDRVFSTHRAIVFVCHSMGGLITQRLLLMNREYAPQVQGIFFYATPQTGAQIAQVASLFSNDPLLRQMTPARWNGYLKAIENDWRSARFSIRRDCAYEKLPYNGMMVVDEMSSTRICDGAPVPMNKNHADIVKPVSTDDDAYIFLKNRWRELVASSAKGQP